MRLRIGFWGVCSCALLVILQAPGCTLLTSIDRGLIGTETPDGGTDGGLAGQAGSPAADAAADAAPDASIIPQGGTGGVGNGGGIPFDSGVDGSVTPPRVEAGTPDGGLDGSVTPPFDSGSVDAGDGG